jgi:RimJ/RimL family protein N-acetyltransferase
VIETPRTIIRPYTGSEAPLLAPIFSDPTTMSFWERPPDEAAVAAWVARAAREFRETGMGKMLVVDRRTGEPIGDCGIMRAEVAGRPENDLGYIIHYPYWGAGLGTECARACLEYGLRAVGLRRVVANMPHDHAASRRVAEKLGMRWERSFPNPRNRGILTHLYALDGGTAGER